MRVTVYFENSQEMADLAKEWAKEMSSRWFIRTTMRCDHVHHEKRKAIILVEGEQVIQKLVTCKTCSKYSGNSVASFINKETNYDKDFVKDALGTIKKLEQ